MGYVGLDKPIPCVAFWHLSVGACVCGGEGKQMPSSDWFLGSEYICH